MKVKKITIDPDPYEPFRLAQGYCVGELLFISGQAAIGGDGQLVGVGNFDAQAEQVFRTSNGFSVPAARALRTSSRSRSSSGTCRIFRRSSNCGVAISRLHIRLTRSSRSRLSTPPKRCLRLRRSLLPTKRRSGFKSEATANAWR